jgi:hypothetical protein
MYKGALIVFAASIAATATASDGDVVGVYRLRVSPEAKSMARMVGRAEPEGSLKLAPDHTFTLSTSTIDSIVIRGGRYYIDGETVTLSFRNHRHLVSGLFRGGRVVLEGLIYERNFADELPIAPPTQRAVWSPDPNPRPLAPAFKPDVLATPGTLPADFSIVGEWTVRKNGTEIPSIRMVFDGDGNFTFKGMGAKSMGKYQVHDCCVTLTWTQVDDDQVEFGTMKKDVPISPDGGSFLIDVYRYERCNKN